MRPRRALCITRDAGVRGVVGPVLAAAGLDVEHRDALPGAREPWDDIAVIVVDRVTRAATGGELCRLRAPVIVVGDDLGDDGLITLMLEAPACHLVGEPRARELSVTIQKLLTGNVFGLEKYLAPGSRAGERVVRSLTERRHAIGEVCAWAESVGARRPVLHRLRSVADELLMNALREVAGGEPWAVLRWACDGDTLAISVADRLGALRQHDVIAHVRRARQERGRPRPSTGQGGSSGAGIGLYLVLAHTGSLIVNIAPGEQTEIVCLFDLAAPSRRDAGRSLHVFAATSGVA